MPYISTNKKAPAATLQSAVIKGLAPDGGLYMPAHIPKLPETFYARLPELSLSEIAVEVARNVLANEVPHNILKPLVEEAINFETPLKEVEKDCFSLELFHGPTMAFKDVGARFMSRLLAYFTAGQRQPIKVIVATSGDTGSAVAAGFHQVPGIEVYILYPKGKVSPLQQKQLTTWGDNIRALEVDGTFDDCQYLVKQALADTALNENHLLTSANSINIARLIPQSFYYFYAFGQLQRLGKPIVFSVPSGNFGNLTGGLLAAAMGLPVHQFIAATNANSVVPEFLETGNYQPRASVQTISNAMDVGNPSNYARMLYLFNEDVSRIKKLVSGYAFTDEETKKAIHDVYQNHDYLLDPHGAVAYCGAKKYTLQAGHELVSAFLETAHPGKFKEVMESTLQQKIHLPERLEAFINKAESITSLSTEYEALRAILSKV
ncbi:threonine synthase [Pontibacter oryzae]|uniref:Threonine synthase n=1 Tax=Pontibacter oryzae TaxID=2304593 RepID=A0A399SGS1_9BACT|nr:threonine synthase [Pontibacter oryzae]RIJ42019.1 threonine synthase [Pontibacter oryzae]